MNWIQVIFSNPTVTKRVALGHLLDVEETVSLSSPPTVWPANNNRWSSGAGAAVWAYRFLQ